MKIVKILVGLVAIVAIIAIAGYTYLKLSFPKVEAAPDMTIERTPERVERGKYLATYVMGCMDCHSQRDWTLYAAPPKPGTEGVGGDVFNQDMGFPGTFYARNITPHGIGDWTDGELYRLITTGVTKEGEPIFPVMPYPSYAKADPEDIKSVIAYIRTLSPINKDIPKSSADFPMNLIMRTIPQPATPTERPSPENKIQYGKYLTTIAACADCHTPAIKGEKIEGMYLAGGFEFKFPFGTVRSSNITPHKEFGIGSWSEDQFVQRFKEFEHAESYRKINEGDFNTLMPWPVYAGMKERDLRAIYQYLMSLEPTPNKVEKFTPSS